MIDLYIALLIMIQEMDPVTYFVTLSGSVVATLWCLYFMVRAFRSRRIMQDTPTSKIRSASQGFVEISGNARALDGALTSPGKGKACVWYRVIARDMRQQNHKRHNQSIFDQLEMLQRTLDSKSLQTTDYEEESSVYSFYVDDGTDMCTVDPTLGKVRAKRSETWRHQHLEMTEYRIEEGDEVYCLGDFKTVQGPSRQKAIKETAKAKLNTWKQDEKIMKKFDKDGDGNIDMEEWNVARATAKKMAIKEVGDDYERTQHHELVKPFDKSHPYLISAYPEDITAKEHLYQSIGYTIGFFVAGASASIVAFAGTI